MWKFSNKVKTDVTEKNSVNISSGNDNTTSLLLSQILNQLIEMNKNLGSHYSEIRNLKKRVKRLEDKVI